MIPDPTRGSRTYLVLKGDVKHSVPRDWPAGHIPLSARQPARRYGHLLLIARQVTLLDFDAPGASILHFGWHALKSS